MNVKEAVGIAKAYVMELFADEQITKVGLEEVKFDGCTDDWKITIGFSRPWDLKNTLTAARFEDPSGRSYKVVAIDDRTRRVESVTDRFLSPPN